MVPGNQRTAVYLMEPQAENIITKSQEKAKS